MVFPNAFGNIFGSNCSGKTLNYCTSTSLVTLPLDAGSIKVIKKRFTGKATTAVKKTEHPPKIASVADVVLRDVLSKGMWTSYQRDVDIL